ncbi:MAG TPA: endonuclease/exonuclease/phosphatase family protein [Verrucomicrobiae bacterium]|nr:endonuclease/exonuclease/phosphatase family protein [Verrucomicrobiae bacterium]
MSTIRARRRLAAGWLAAVVAFAPAAAVVATPGATVAATPATTTPATTLSPGSDGALRVASWNIEWLAARDGAGAVPRRSVDYDRLHRYADELDADIVALQEVEGAGAARRVFDPGRYEFLFAAGGGSVQRAGFAWKKGLRVTPHPDFVAIGLDGRSRRAADITVHTAHGDLRLLSIHLKSGCASGRLDGPDAACAMLRTQARRLEEWVDARAGEAVPFAVLGDFNRRFTAKDPFWNGLDDSDPPEADLLDAGFGRHPPCWGGRYRQYIDHIVLSRTAATWLVPNSFAQQVYDPADEASAAVLSDHCPIIALLDSSRAASPLRSSSTKEPGPGKKGLPARP